ncbi:NAD-dependent epimerase/dehydratase family protein [Isoptericola variabilis]|uniref:NAD-dependent epimerase/dehydratase n=1 Tax=Isoptericola variabilis (strain 225) TaxID=743718 RepID=F6FPL7_ISOV2|nr:NAD-dependent epimerase/dehydratase family protein [Isoptericola variabilis]AEG44749.1 NAD-dependent epimerase/dehydratase [Isoptericola variabilis 225]
MKLLVLGGSMFLSRAVVEAALERGHEVVAANRGRSGTVPDGARHVVLDRADGIPDDLAAEGFDAVVDVSRTPSHVRSAVAALADAHWVFVSSISVYADDATPHGGPDTLPLHEPEHDDVDLRTRPDAYGPMKVACEQLVRDGAASSVVVRPGLIVGPGDPTGRFTYWPARLSRVADGGPPDVLAPGNPGDLVQVIDVRDLAAWIVLLAERRTEGVLDAIAPAVPIGTFLDDVAAGCRAAPRWRWASHARLEQLGVAPWAGERSLPLWLPRPASDGMMSHDAGPALAAG